MKVFSPFLNGDTTTSGSFTLPQHPTASAIINPNTGSIYHDTTDNIVKVYTGTQWQVLGEQTTPVAGGGGASGIDIEYLLIAGGSSGGRGSARSGGGGGAGGYISSSLSSIESGSSITVTVGGGGAAKSGADGQGIDGDDSTLVSAGGTSFSTVTAIGGGGGGYPGAGRNGGSGGGGAHGGGIGGSGTVGQGNDGGDGSGESPYAGAGGGGAGAAGSNSSAGSAGAGGSGLGFQITGTLTTKAGGGGGGGSVTAAGGQGGGGAGGTTTGTSGTANTGGGGGGAQSTSGAGGSGVVILAYDTGSGSATGGQRVFTNNRVAHIFNSSGTFYVGGSKTYTHNSTDPFGDSSGLALYQFENNANDASGYSDTTVQIDNNNAANYFAVNQTDTLGKYYFEVEYVSKTTANTLMVGLYTSGYADGWQNLRSRSYYGSNGYKYKGTTSTAYGATFDVGDIIGVAFDGDNDTITYYKNNVSQGTAFSGTEGDSSFGIQLSTGLYAASTRLLLDSNDWNYSAPSGFTEWTSAKNAFNNGQVTTSGASKVVLNYNGTANSVTYNQSQINNGAVFNGSAYIESSGLKSALPYGSAARSFSFWVNLSSFSGDVYFFSYGEGTNGQFFAGRVQSSPQNIGFMGYAADYTTNTAMTTNEWMHLVYTYDGTTLKIYKNGSEIGSSTLTLNTVNSRRFCIGARDYNGTVEKYINGSMDQFRVFNKALSAAEVLTLYKE